MSTNTVKTITGHDTYAQTGPGFKKSVPELRKYETALLEYLTSGDRLAHTKYLKHETLPKNMGDTLNLRKYFGLEADPRKLGLDKNTIDGPILKELAGASIEMKLEWFGNGISFNDVSLEIHLDNLMQLAMPRLMRNSKQLMDNIAGLATYEGASKAFIKAYDGSTGAVTLGTDSTTVAGNLNHNILRHIAKLMLNNKEEFTLSDGKTKISLRGRIRPINGDKYRVLVSEDGMDDLLDDPKFEEKFIKGISAQELRDNKIVSLYRYTLETIDNNLTIEKTSGDVKLEGEGDLQVAFMIGKDYAADIKLAGGAIRMFSKLPNTTDSGDIYGRFAFASYKLAYNVQVINSKAVYAVVYAPKTYATGSMQDTTKSVPQQ